MTKRQTLRIGCGSTNDGDRLDWVANLARSGAVSYLGFDCLAEATMTFAQLRRVLDPAAGYALTWPRWSGSSAERHDFDLAAVNRDRTRQATKTKKEVKTCRKQKIQRDQAGTAMLASYGCEPLDSC
jgi:Acyclic terpene utilisation family protein AtuA